MSEPIGPLDASVVPRFAGPATFARLPTLSEVGRADVGVLGIPFDSGTSYRPGARFGPQHVRASSRLLRPYNPALDVQPFAVQQVADLGDLGVTPFDISSAITEIGSAVRCLEQVDKLVTIGGDHTVTLPLLRQVADRYGPVAVIHFDAHLDTWDTYFGAPYTHGTTFRRAWEEGLLDPNGCIHLGVRGPLYGPEDLTADDAVGFQIITSEALEDGGARVADRVRGRAGSRPVYLSIDIDVLDPAFAPGTGTPEAGGLSSRELLSVLRRLAGLNIVGADVVEVSPAYDHAEITGVAAAHVCYELLSLIALSDPSE